MYIVGFFMQYFQEKFNAGKKLNSTADLSLEIEKDSIIYRGLFYMDFQKGEESDGVTFKHELYLNRENGEFLITYEIINKIRAKRKPQSNSWIKRGDFEKLNELTHMGFYRGEKRKDFWGIKYERKTTEFFDEIKRVLQKEITDPYLKNKTYYKPVINKLFDLIVDYHLFKKQIKGHDNVYVDIQLIYPKKKWLKLNDDKFLPSILDEYGIKSKYLIKELSKREDPIHIATGTELNIKAVAYMCGLFGENYVEYIKKFNWKLIANKSFNKTKRHKCKNDSEKNTLIHIFNEYTKLNESADRDTPRVDNLLLSLYKLIEVREFLEENGFTDLKLSQLRTPDEVELLLPYWEILKTYHRIGYMMKYKIPQEVIDNIQLPIKKRFFPKVLLSDRDFCYEGHRMKNCMAQQFIHGSIYIYISLTDGKHTVDLQYQRGKLHQAYGKANTPIPDHFKEVVEILTKKMMMYETLKWDKEKVVL